MSTSTEPSAPSDRASVGGDEIKKPELVKKLQAQRARQKQRSKAFRAATVVGGFLTVALGIVALPFPGPGWLIIFVGLALLSLEFDWAGRALDWLLLQVAKYTREFQQASRGTKVAIYAVVLLVVAGLLAWAYFGDIPLIPEPGAG